jgi:hypothetical protein
MAFFSLNSESNVKPGKLGNGSECSITCLYVKCAGKNYAVRSAAIQLALGAVSSCTLSVISKLGPGREIPGYNYPRLDVESNYDSLLDGFKYGNRATVYQVSARGEIVLFDGYVAAAGSAFSSSLASVNLEYSVMLQSAAAMYSSHSKHLGAAYLTMTSGQGQFEGCGPRWDRLQQTTKCVDSEYYRLWVATSTQLNLQLDI